MTPPPTPPTYAELLADLREALHVAQCHLDQPHPTIDRLEAKYAELEPASLVD